MSTDQELAFFDKVFVRSPFYCAADFKVERLPGMLADPAFLNALWLASPGYYRVLEKKSFDAVRLSPKERFTVLKYFNRMCFRPVPFGAFAGFTLAPWTVSGPLELVPGKHSLVHALPSVAWLTAYQEFLEKKATDGLLSVNPTLYRLGKTYRYVVSVPDQEGRLRFTIHALAVEKLTVYLLRLLNRVPLRYTVLSDRLTERSGCTSAEAAGFVDFLIREQVLLSEWQLRIISDQKAAGGDSEIEPATGEKDQVIRQFWKGIRLIPTFEQKSWPLVAGQLEAINPSFDIPNDERYFYAALERPLHNGGIATGVQASLLKTLSCLQLLLRSSVSSSIQQFVTDFTARFDQQKIPLLTALDPDAGLGYAELTLEQAGPRLLEGIAFERQDRQPLPVDWTAAQRLLFRVWQGNADRSTFDPILLSSGSLDSLEPSKDAVLPPSMAVVFRQTAQGILLESAGGATATSLVGRFSVFSSEVETLCLDIAATEATANPGVLFAEIEQRSHEHVDNINRRTRIYPYTIPVNVFSAGARQHSISLNDLVVSVKRGEVILESVNLKKRVLPRLPTAYNFRNNEMGVFRFLCDLQFQGLQANLTFELEKFFPGLNFYPRVALDDVIISQARWILGQTEITELTVAPYSLGRLHIFRQTRGLPSLVTAGVHDQQLVFDLSDDAQALFFLDHLKEQQRAVIQEYLPADRSIKTGNEPLSGQCIALLYKKAATYPAIPAVQAFPEAQPVRSFLLGSTWIYLKFYCTVQTANLILTDLILPVLRRYDRLIDQWFFIRFEDKGTHIRLRIKTPADHVGELLQAFEKKVSGSRQNHLVREYLGDTYQREIERYGADAIEAVESIFHTGSAMVMAELTAVIRGTGAEELAAFIYVLRMSEAFIQDPDECLLFFKARSTSFFQEFGGAKALQIEMDAKYRMLRKQLELALENEYPGQETRQHELTVQFLKKITALSEAQKGAPQVKRWSLIADLIHMQVNRMFISRQRQYEALIYFCLHRYTMSLQARRRKITSS